jgi:transcriptional regulator with GAF, ATPase, and Fis domain
MTSAKRNPSKLTEIGDRARRKAQKHALLRSLRANGWNLTATATALEMGSHANVIRSIHELGLSAEYEAARSARLVVPGGRRAA